MSNSVKNFEMLELILKRVDKLILIGSLGERHAVVIFQKFLTQRVQDEICSYLKEEFLEMTFKQILTTAQFFYIPLCLRTFERVVLGYRIIKNTETFLEFASKSFRHLRLCSRLYPVDDREQYIEGNLKKILKFSLPVALLATIQKKKSLYHTFSSSELIDHYVSYSHTVSEGKLPEINSQYKVFRTGTAPGTFRQQNEHKDADMRSCNICEGQGHIARNCPNKDIKGQRKREPVVQAVTTEPCYGDLTSEQVKKQR